MVLSIYFESYDTLSKECSYELIKLCNNLENLFKVAATNSAYSPGIGILVDGLLLRYKDKVTR